MCTLRCSSRIAPRCSTDRISRFYQQVAATVVKALGIGPNELEVVPKEQIQVLPFLFNTGQQER